MKIEILPTADAVARRGASVIGQQARAAINERGRFVFAVSGGTTPWVMLRELAAENLPWDKVHILQVDERVAPEGDADRNLTQLLESLKDVSGLPRENIHPMPVTDPNLDDAATSYAETLKRLTGSPPVIDLVHLGLGSDGHTASLVPGDAVLKVNQAEVALTTSEYQGRRRMTLTYPAINRARQILWLVTGSSKAEAVSRMADGDAAIPAGRIRQSSSLLIVDDAASSHLAAASDRETGED